MTEIERPRRITQVDAERGVPNPMADPAKNPAAMGEGYFDRFRDVVAKALTIEDVARAVAIMRMNAVIPTVEGRLYALAVSREQWRSILASDHLPLLAGATDETTQYACPKLGVFFTVR
jgi:hypothetical protein